MRAMLGPAPKPKSNLPVERKMGPVSVSNTAWREPFKECVPLGRAHVTCVLMHDVCQLTTSFVGVLDASDHVFAMFFQVSRHVALVENDLAYGWIGHEHSQGSLHKIFVFDKKEIVLQENDVFEITQSMHENIQ